MGGRRPEPCQPSHLGHGCVLGWAARSQRPGLIWGHESGAGLQVGIRQGLSRGLCLQVKFLTPGHCGACCRGQAGWLLDVVGGKGEAGVVVGVLHQTPAPSPGPCAARPAGLTPWLSCVLQDVARPRAPPRKWGPSQP